MPGSKSLANRCLSMAGLASGRSVVRNLPRSDDVVAMIDGLRALGAEIGVAGGKALIRGLERGHATGTVHVEASGTALRFLVAISSVVADRVVITAGSRLSERPLEPLLESLRTLGAAIEGDRPPLVIHGKALPGGETPVDTTLSSQFASALAIIGPLMPRGIGLTWRTMPSRPYLDATVETLATFGVTAALDDRSLVVPAGSRYRATEGSLPSDASSAVYPALAAAITGGEVLLVGLPLRPPQADLVVLEVLRMMGCRIAPSAAGVRVSGPAGRLRAVDVDLRDAPDGAIAVGVAAAFADGPSRISGLRTLAGKESDRLESLTEGLGRLGAVVRRSNDGMIITPGPLHGGEIAGHGDHRIVMAFAVAGLALDGVVVAEAETTTKSWPGFFADMEVIAGPDWAMVSSPMKPGVIAIDGPGGSGKTTVSREVARRLKLPHLDTGAFYRAVTLAALRAGRPADLGSLAATLELEYEDGVMYLHGEDVSRAIREQAVTDYVSEVSAEPVVRSVMVDRQRRWVTERGGSAVVEGRDIGTVVFPDAAVKVFLTARPEIRAARRAGETRTEDLEQVASTLERRDRLDSSRAVSPLVAADDAVVIDTSDLTVREVADRIVQLVVG